MDSRVRALYKIDARPEAAAQARRIIAEELSSRLSARVVTDIQLNPTQPVQLGGWGLRVVEELSDRWGMQHSAQRTEVWFVRQCA